MEKNTRRASDVSSDKPSRGKVVSLYGGRLHLPEEHDLGAVGPVGLHAARVGGKPHRLIVWDDEPLDFTERAAAIRALYEANQVIEKELGRKERELLAGLLYWKLSTQPSHHDIEPFVHILGAHSEDPLSREWGRFIE